MVGGSGGDSHNTFAAAYRLWTHWPITGTYSEHCTENHVLGCCDTAAQKFASQLNPLACCQSSLSLTVEMSTATSTLQDMLISNVSGISEAGVVIVGHKDLPIEKVVLANLNLKLGNLTKFAGGYRDLRPGPADIEKAAPAALYARNVQELVVSVRSVFFTGQNISVSFT